MNSAQLLARAAAAGQRSYGQSAPDPSLMSSAELEAKLAGESNIYSDVGRLVGGTLGTIGKVLDTPGAIARGVLAGKPLSGLGWSDESRISGEELLENYGLLGKKTGGWKRTLGGLAAEIFTDPLALVSGPAKALGAAGEIASLAGLMKHAPLAAAKVLGPAANTTRTGKGTIKFFNNLLTNGAALTPGNLAVRPLVGPRVANNMLNIQQLISASPDPTKALRDVQVALKAKNMTMDSIKGQKLGGSLRFQVGEGKLIPPVMWSPRGKTAMSVLDAMDAAGNAFDWSPLARATSAVFDDRVNGRYNTLSQLGGLRRDARLRTNVGATSEAFTDHVLKVNRLALSPSAQKIVGGKDLNTQLGGEFLTRLYEGALVNSDKALINEIGQSRLDDIANSWEGFRTAERNEAKALGMVTRRYRSPFGIEWSPRKAAEAKFDDYAKGIGRKSYNARTLENEARKKYLNTPGGTYDLQLISRLPLVNKFVKEGAKSGISREQVGAEIKRFLDARHGTDSQAGQAYLKSVGLARDERINPFKLMVKQLDPATGKPILLPQQGPLKLNKAGQLVPLKPRPVLTGEAIDLAQAEKIAGFMGRKNPNLAANVPMFGGHPSMMQASAVVSAATARTNAQHIYESLAEAAEWAGKKKSATSIAGNLRRPLDIAMVEAAKAAGLESKLAKKATEPMSHTLLREAIAKREGKHVSEINLKEWSVQEEVLDRLTAAKDVFEVPRAMKELSQLLTTVNGIYKGFLLAFPATKTRDLYSNTYQVWAMTGSHTATLGGFSTAWKVVNGNTKDASADLLRTIPAYFGSKAPLDDLTRDVARTGILKTLSSSDLATSNRAANLNQLIPGMVPQKLSDFAKEMMPNGSRNEWEMAGDYFTFKDVRYPWQQHAATETKNSLLNASQKVNDFTDSVGRLGGMLALMSQGMAAEEAARKITAGLVDYGSLTLVEKSIFKTIFPWWSYQSRSGAWAAKEILQNPGGRYAQTLRGFNRIQESNETTYIPEALRQQFALAIPDWIKEKTGLGKSDTTTFIKDFDISGHDVASLPVLGPTFYDAAQGTASNIAGQTNPLIRSAIELATGKDLFSKRPLREADSSLDKVYRGLTGSTGSLNPIVRQALNLIPSPRWSGLAANYFDPRIPNTQTRAVKMAINTLFGVKLQDVDLQYQLSDARRMYEGQLGEVMRNQSIPFIPADKKLLLTPQQQRDYEMFQMYDKRLRAERKRINLLNAK